MKSVVKGPQGPKKVTFKNVSNGSVERHVSNLLDQYSNPKYVITKRYFGMSSSWILSKWGKDVAPFDKLNEAKSHANFLEENNA